MAADAIDRAPYVLTLVPGIAQPKCISCNHAYRAMEVCECGYAFLCKDCSWPCDTNSNQTHPAAACAKLIKIRNQLPGSRQTWLRRLKFAPDYVSIGNEFPAAARKWKSEFCAQYVKTRIAEINCLRRIGTGPAIRQACYQEYQLLKYGQAPLQSANLYFELMKYHEHGEILCHQIIEAMSLTRVQHTEGQRWTNVSRDVKVLETLQIARLYVRSVPENWEYKSMDDLDLGNAADPPTRESWKTLQRLSELETSILWQPITRGFGNEDFPQGLHEDSALVAQLLIKMRSIATLRSLHLADVLSGFLPNEIINEVRVNLLDGVVGEDRHVIKAVRYRRDLRPLIDTLLSHCDIICSVHGESQHTLARLAGLFKHSCTYECDQSSLYKAISAAIASTPSVIPVLKKVCLRRPWSPHGDLGAMTFEGGDWNAACRIYKYQRRCLESNESSLWRIRA